LKLLEKIAGYFGERKEEPTEYGLEELAGLLREEEKKRKDAAYLEAEPILKDIHESIDNIKALALDIKDKECPEEVNIRAKTVLRTAKPEFVREVLEAVKGAGGERKKEPSEDKRAIDETLDLLAKALMGPGKYLPLAYGEDLDRIKKELKALAVKRKKLEETAIINDDASDILKDIDSLRERISRVSLLEKERNETAQGLETLEKEETTLTEEKERIKKGREYAEYLEKKEREEKIRCEKEEKESRVYNLLTPLKRPLKMLRKSLEEKGKHDAYLKEIERYAQDPVETLCSADEKELPKLLSDLKKNMEKSPEIKDEEKNRVKQRIAAIETEDIQKTRNDIISLRKQEEELMREISSANILAKKTENEKETDRMRREITQKKEDLARMEKKIEKEDAFLKTEKQSLEEKTSRLKNNRIYIALK
jgi:hypothetical protein